jgi:hypothetical protein
MRFYYTLFHLPAFDKVWNSELANCTENEKNSKCVFGCKSWQPLMLRVNKDEFAMPLLAYEAPSKEEFVKDFAEIASKMWDACYSEQYENLEE